MGEVVGIGPSGPVSEKLDSGVMLAELLGTSSPGFSF